MNGYFIQETPDTVMSESGIRITKDPLGSNNVPLFFFEREQTTATNYPMGLLLASCEQYWINLDRWPLFLK